MNSRINHIVIPLLCFITVVPLGECNRQAARQVFLIMNKSS